MNLQWPNLIEQIYSTKAQDVSPSTSHHPLSHHKLQLEITTTYLLYTAGWFRRSSLGGGVKLALLIAPSSSLLLLGELVCPSRSMSSFEDVIPADIPGGMGKSRMPRRGGRDCCWEALWLASSLKQEEKALFLMLHFIESTCKHICTRVSKCVAIFSLLTEVGFDSHPQQSLLYFAGKWMERVTKSHGTTMDSFSYSMLPTQKSKCTLKTEEHIHLEITLVLEIWLVNI